MSINSNILYWQYGVTKLDTASDSTKHVISQNQKYLFNQTNDTTGIQLPTSTGEDILQSSSSVNLSAKTNYSGSSTTTVKVVLNDDGTVNSNYTDDNTVFSGFMEFDMYGSTTQSLNPFTSNEAQCFNRVSQETRNKFMMEIQNLLSTNSTQTLKEILAQMSDSEIITLNHFAGNIFISSSGQMYRQPTDEEYLEGNTDWISIPDGSNEYLIRMAAMNRLNVPTEEIPSEGEDNDNDNDDTGLNVSAKNAEEGLTLFYKNSTPLALPFAVADSNVSSEDLENDFIIKLANDTDILEDACDLDDSDDFIYKTKNSDLLTTDDVDSFTSLVQEVLENENITEQVNTDLLTSLGEQVALGVAKFKPQIASELMYVAENFTNSSNEYESVKFVAQNDDDFALLSTEDNNVSGVELKLLNGNYMYIIETTDSDKEKSFDELYTEAKAMTRTATSTNDSVTVPNLNFTRTMDYDCNELRCTEVQQFALGEADNELSVTDNNKLDFTGKNFVILFASEDKDEPYYAVRIDDDTKKYMFVTA